MLPADVRSRERCVAPALAGASSSGFDQLRWKLSDAKDESRRPAAAQADSPMLRRNLAIRSLLKWIILKELLDFLQNVRSELFGCFRGCQSFFKLVFFRGAKNHRADVWVFQDTRQLRGRLGRFRGRTRRRRVPLLSRSFRR